MKIYRIRIGSRVDHRVKLVESMVVATGGLFRTRQFLSHLRCLYNDARSILSRVKSIIQFDECHEI